MALPASDLSHKRCAVYTRKSSEHGLAQEFNSLNAQHAICSAYIKSQQHKGWIELEKGYEDAGQSGASLDRPAMQELLADIQRGRIDVVVVYKLDRLSRSLLDFVRLMDVLDRYGVSFACITQNFDTADSLGRLVMNILLTFAQFEREMTGDRIRDKRRAMGLRGLWSGGRPPLGYELVNHRLVVNDAEASIVRHIYQRYLATKNLTEVARSCRAVGYSSKSRCLPDGKLRAGVPLSPASVRKILMNPVYTGLIHAGSQLTAGQHRPLICKADWDRVCAIRESQIAARLALCRREVLDGLMYDSFGRSMTVNRSKKGGKFSLHYRSNQNAWCARHEIKRMRASSDETEKLVVYGLQELLCDRERFGSLLTELGCSPAIVRSTCQRGEIASRRLGTLNRDQLRSALRGVIARIEVSRERTRLITRPIELRHLANWDFAGLFQRRAEDTEHAASHLLDISCAGSIRLERFVRLPITSRKSQTYRVNKSLRTMITEAQSAWATVVANREASPERIAKEQNMTLSRFMRLLRLNYLAPDIVTSILDGAQPRHLTRRIFMDANLPLDWTLQRRLFGFPEQPPIMTCERGY